MTEKIPLQFWKDARLLKNSLFAGTAMGSGNFICQKYITNKNQAVDRQKVFIFSSFGALFTGPWFRYWRPFIRNFLIKKGHFRYQSLKLTIMDQAVSPYVLNTALIFYKNIFELKKFDQTLDDIKKKLPTIVITSYKFWPFLMLFNFYYIPYNYQFYVSIIASIFWNIGLSYMLTNQRVEKSI